jgi:hypothetical protein
VCEFGCCLLSLLMQRRAYGLVSISSLRLSPSKGLPQSIRHLRSAGHSEAAFVFRLRCSLRSSCYALWKPLSRGEGMKRKVEPITNIVERISIALRGVGEQVALTGEMVTNHLGVQRTERAGLDFLYSRGGTCTAGELSNRIYHCFDRSPCRGRVRRARARPKRSEKTDRSHSAEGACGLRGGVRTHPRKNVQVLVELLRRGSGNRGRLPHPEHPSPR